MPRRYKVGAPRNQSCDQGSYAAFRLRPPCDHTPKTDTACKRLVTPQATQDTKSRARRKHRQNLPRGCATPFFKFRLLYNHRLDMAIPRPLRQKRRPRPLLLSAPLPDPRRIPVTVLVRTPAKSKLQMSFKLESGRNPSLHTSRGDHRAASFPRGSPSLTEDNARIDKKLQMPASSLSLRSQPIRNPAPLLDRLPPQGCAPLPRLSTHARSKPATCK